MKVLREVLLNQRRMLKERFWLNSEMADPVDDSVCKLSFVSQDTCGSTGDGARRPQLAAFRRPLASSRSSDVNHQTIPLLSDIRDDFERVDAAVIERASAFAASILADVAGRRGTLDGRIRPLSHSMRIAGPAFTIEVRAGDNLMIH